MLYALRDKKERTVKEIARDTLESGLSFYETACIKIAEEGFKTAQKYMENKQPHQ